MQGLHLVKFDTSDAFELKVQGLTASRGYNLLFQSLNLSMSPGEFTVVKGPNGSGKSTLLRIIAGLTEADFGTITRPVEIGDAGPFYLGHLDGLRLQDTPDSHLTYWAQQHGYSTDELNGTLNRVGLADRRLVPVYALSAGQKKRIALARALLVPRTLWLLDEPAAALDNAGQTLLCEMIDEHTQSGGLCLAALHEPLALTPNQTVDLMEFQP